MAAYSYLHKLESLHHTHIQFQCIGNCSNPEITGDGKRCDCCGQILLRRRDRVF